MMDGDVDGSGIRRGGGDQGGKVCGYFPGGVARVVLKKGLSEACGQCLLSVWSRNGACTPKPVTRTVTGCSTSVGGGCRAVEDEARGIGIAIGLD